MFLSDVLAADDVQVLELTFRWTLLEPICGMEGAGCMGMGALEDHYLDSHRKDLPQPVCANTGAQG
jgi:hypothetical protein